MANTSSNILIAMKNYADVNAFFAPVFNTSAYPNGLGLWSADTPLTNLQNRFLSIKSRTLDCVPDSTQFVIDLGTTRDIEVVVIPTHNLLTATSPTATVTLYADAALTQMVASKSISVYPSVYSWGSLAWGSSSWWAGTVSPEDASAYPQPILFIWPTPQLARYVKVQINDPANAVGYIELSRLFVCPGYQPSVNIKYGAQLAVADDTIVTRSMGGADYYDQRPHRRTMVMSIDYLPQNEAFSQIFDAEIRMGTSGQGFVAMFPADGTNLARTSFLFTFAKLDPLTAAAYGVSGVSLALQEVVA